MPEVDKARGLAIRGRGGKGVKAGSSKTSRAKSVVESELIGRAHARY